MKIKIFFSIILFTINVNAQQLNDTSIIGTWKVTQILFPKNANSEQKEQLKLLEQSFLNSNFIFKVDKHFDFNFDFNDMAIKNGHWKFDKKKEKIIIQEWKDRNTNKFLLMEINLVFEESKIYFALTETPFLLEMIKEETK